MDHLVSILDSFCPGWRERKYLGRMIEIFKEQILLAYSYLNARIENNRAVFSGDWDQILSALKEAHVFKLFVPAEYGGEKSSEIKESRGPVP